MTQARGRVGVVAGVPTLMGHVARLRGFRKRLARCPELPVVAVENSLTTPRLAPGAVTRDSVPRSHPEIDAMFVVTAGCEGVCRALISAGRAGEIRVVGYDDVPATREMMRLGIVRAVVCQQPFEQGLPLAARRLDMVLSGEMMDDRRIIMENQIKLPETSRPAPGTAHFRIECCFKLGYPFFQNKNVRAHSPQTPFAGVPERNEEPLICLLGVDLGTSGTKTVLFDAEGREVASQSVEYPLYQPQNGWAEQDPRDWWNAAVSTIRGVLEKSGVNPGDVKGLGISGQMHGLVLLDENGEPLGRSLLWCDGRTQRECDEITQAGAKSASSRSRPTRR